ncbi:MAG TPA: DUF4856 domain-containing protein [Polyangiales bacterium]|nr:DUF4856 domain-containing protein [Polyangiales bacterium]
MRALFFAFLLGFAAFLGACSDSGDGGGNDIAPQTYRFEREGQSTVAYTGQSTRQVLIRDLVGLMRSISDAVLAGENLDRYDTREEVYALLTPLYEQGGVADPSRAIPQLVADGDATLQETYADFNDANLQDKVAGNDPVTDHVDWTGGAFEGWSAANLVVNAAGDLGTPATPEELVLALFWTFADQAAAGAAGSFPIDAATPLYLTPAGHDLTQLVEKFLLVAIGFSQGADDYLDDDVADKGLLSANEIAGDNSYTTLEHQWDEGYGYWGAAREYGAYTDEEIAAAGGRPEYENGYYDANDDGLIDLMSEYNFGASVNAAKRDLGSAENAPTDFTAEADLAWRTGRAIIAAAYEAGEEVDLAALRAQRDIVVMVWEKAYAATAIHYINDVLEDMDAIDTPEYSFADHAKHWSELKGFALSFQFNPGSPMSESDFASVHAAIGDAPVGASATSPVDDEAYRTQLLDARSLIGDAYDFDEANITGW